MASLGSVQVTCSIDDLRIKPYSFAYNVVLCGSVSTVVQMHIVYQLLSSESAPLEPLLIGECV